MANANFTLWSAGRFDRCAQTLNGDMLSNTVEAVPLVHAGADHLLSGMHQGNVALHDGPRKFASQLTTVAAGYLVGLGTLPNGSKLVNFAVKILDAQGCTFDLVLKSGVALVPDVKNRVAYNASDVATVTPGAVTGMTGPTAPEQRVVHTFYFNNGLITAGNADELQLKFASVPAAGLKKVPRVQVLYTYQDSISHW